MSYPRRIQPLIIEDDPAARRYYEEIFLSLDGLPVGLSIAAPRFAVSFDEAKYELTTNRTFELVILDLCIPRKSNHPANEGIALGESVLELCLERDHCPIPGLLVVTGNIASTGQSLLRSRLERGFAYAEPIAKGGGGELLRSEIEQAAHRIAAYLNVGIEIKSDDPGAGFSFHPREDDLLRRAALDMDVVGLDLRWQPIRSAAERVLTGHARLADGGEAARTFSFRFEHSDEFDRIVMNARALERRQPSFRIIYSARSGTQMLLVTEEILPAMPSVNHVENPGDTVREREASVALPTANPRADSENIEDGGRWQRPSEPAPRAPAFVMARRAKVVELIGRHRDTQKYEALINELEKCDNEFAGLEVEFVRNVLSRKRKGRQPSNANIAAEFTLQVGAFNEAPEADLKKSSVVMRRLTKSFDEAARRERQR